MDNPNNLGRRVRQPRLVLTEAQLVQLEDTYDNQPYPHFLMRVELVCRIGLTANTISTWFRNRRARELGRRRRQVANTPAVAEGTHYSQIRLTEINGAVSAKVAIPEQLLQAFTNKSIVEDNEITEIEEFIFKNVLKHKMTCDVCMTNMKRYRCWRCFYSMCSECTNQVVNVQPNATPCPHCREPHSKFLSIILPKFISGSVTNGIDIAIQDQLVEAFALTNENEAEIKEVTETEEIVFQNVLKKKMSCDICTVKIKRYRCSKCFYSMCQDCTTEKMRQQPGTTQCPNCKEPHKKFLTLMLPRL